MYSEINMKIILYFCVFFYLAEKYNKYKYSK